MESWGVVISLAEETKELDREDLKTHNAAKDESALVENEKAIPNQSFASKMEPGKHYQHENQKQHPHKPKHSLIVDDVERPKPLVEGNPNQ